MFQEVVKEIMKCLDHLFATHMRKITWYGWYGTVPCGASLAHIICGPSDILVVPFPSYLKYNILR